MIKKALINLIEAFFHKKFIYETNKKTKFIKKHFKENSEIPQIRKKINILDNRGFLDKMIFKDENWNYIKNLNEYLNSIKKGNVRFFEDNSCEKCSNKFIIEDEKMIVHTDSLNDNWLCFYLNSIDMNCYEISFDIILFSVFTEIQMAFNYEDLGNRYRFMIRNNNEAVFECVYHGEFYHSLWSKKIQLELGKKHNITLTVIKNKYMLYIDKMLFFSIKEMKPFINGDRFCIILWNENDQNIIDCQISNILVNKLECNDE